METTSQSMHTAVTRGQLFTITIDPNGYQGNLALGPAHAGDYFTLVAPIAVQVTLGENFINTGASLGGKTGPNTSYIYFEVTPTGQITNILQPNAAYASTDGKTLILKTTAITIKPGDYRNHYDISAKIRMPLHGDVPIRLVCYQLYKLDCGIHLDLTSIIGSSSDFTFFVDEHGYVTPTNTLCASPSQSELVLKTVTALLDPAAISNGLPTRLPDGTKVSAKQPVTFIRGLLTRINWPETGSYYFTPTYTFSITA